MSLSCDALIEYVRSLNPRGELGGEEGVIHGPKECTAEGILVTWMPTVAAIRHAMDEDCRIMLSHEALTFHDYFPDKIDDEPWAADRARLPLLDEAGITVVRAHSTVDPTHVVPGFIRAIGLEPAIKQGSVWSYHEQGPVTVREMARQAAAGVGMDRVRVTGDPDHAVSRIGTMVGGLGQDRHVNQWERHLVTLGVELIIVGETNDFAQWFAIDSEIAVIETCHSASEEPGLTVLADDLRAEFPDARFVFHKMIAPWELI